MGSKRKRHIVDAELNNGSNEPKTKRAAANNVKCNPPLAPKRKKSRKVKPDPAEEIFSKEEMESDHEASASAIGGVDKNKTDCPQWPEHELAELIRRIETAIPERDSLRYQSRVERIDWDAVAFSTYTGEECKVMWEFIERHLRRFRLLKEILIDAKAWVAQPWQHYKNQKKIPHPDLPRRPLTSYMIFYMKNKDKVLKENGNMEMTALSKHIAEMYKNLTPSRKEKYINLAAEERKVYENKMEKFYRTHPDLVPKKGDRGRGSKDSTDTAPKKPFKMFYENKLQQAASNVDKNTFLETCKEQWKALSDNKKLYWIDLALEQEEKYKEDLKAYITDHPDYVHTQKTQNLLTKEERVLKERMAGKPDKPPTSAYSLFSRIMLSSDKLKDINPKDRMTLIAQKWKNCTLDEKTEYKDRAIHMMEQYKLEYATYLDSLPEEKRLEELLSNQPKRKPSNKLAKKPEREIEEIDVVESKETAKSPVPTKEKKSKLKHDPNKMFELPQPKTLYENEPPQPPITPLLLYAQKVVGNKQLSRGEVETMWANLSSKEKAKYRDKLTDMKQVYIRNYEQFLKSLTPEQLSAYSRFNNAERHAKDDDSISGSSSDSDSDNEEEKEVTSSASSASYSSSSCESESENEEESD